MQTTSVNPREAHAVFLRNKLTLPIDDPFWSRHRPGDQWNCKCWLEQTDAPATKKEDMPPSSDMPEPKAGLKGNPAKTKEIFSQDHPHFPDKCVNCFAYEKKDKKNFSFFDFTKDCPNCPMVARCMINLIPDNKEASKEFVEWSKKWLIGKEYNAKGLGAFKVTTRTIKENASYGPLLHAKVDVFTHLKEYLQDLNVREVPIEHDEKGNIKAFYEGVVEYKGTVKESVGKNVLLQFKKVDKEEPILYFVKFI